MSWVFWQFERRPINSFSWFAMKAPDLYHVKTKIVQTKKDAFAPFADWASQQKGEEEEEEEAEEEER